MKDGKLILVTNVPDVTPTDVVARYKALADIERGFRVLKSEIDIAPVYHRLPSRNRAHALICFPALVLYRVLRMRLRDRGNPYSPERALEIARRIQFHQVALHQQHIASGLSTLSAEQKELFAALNLPPPTANAVHGQKFYPYCSKISDLREKVSHPGDMRSMLGNPYDGHTLAEAPEQAASLSDTTPEIASQPSAT